ncbi:MAG: sigma 54-interacting transcriptional regulator, partial [Rhodospirillaceae bacterium]|nr:sigma 54-interacting transcriptional regulator [Rhodospirillaceae bacterium]
MKLSDVVFLKPGQTTSDEGGTLPADADLFSLSERRFQSLPERVAIVDGDSLGAVVEKELLSFLRRRCSANQLLAMLENAPIGVVAIDNDSRIFYANFAYTRILGVPKQRVLGQYMRVLEPEAEILKVLNGSESVIDRTVWITSVKRHVRVNIAPIALNGRAWGAVSFFTDVTESTRLAGELSRAKNLADHFQRELETQAELPQGFDDIIGRNSRFVKVLQTAGIVAKTDAPVLIQGEHGVGKEVLARAVHRASPRATRPFISVNCAAVPETLLESELFG